MLTLTRIDKPTAFAAEAAHPQRCRLVYSTVTNLLTNTHLLHDVIIVFLNGLWIRAVPSKLGRIKAKMVEELEERVFERRQRLVLCKGFAAVVFSLKPEVFDRIRIGRIGGKRQTDHLPVFFIKARLDLG